LNCGSCGYNTCREKAIAVCQGKADVSMCLPYLMDRTERFSNNILNNSPIGVLVLNEEYEVQQINRAAMKMLRIGSELDVLGEQVVRVMDPMPFIDVLENGKIVRERLEYYAEYKKYIELTVVHDKNTHILIALLRDVTEAEMQRHRKEELERHTVEIADKVVEKQMRIVQEIASLLGETTAETKIALTKLKESIVREEENE
ncbi:MAG TPA: histidine kinase, partial [Candidatus Aphodomonas merdavium]|nr:histidine kinase [Candidatus Aphodomonas merdavium]